MAVKKIVWAINPYSFSEMTDNNTVAFLKELKRLTQAEIQPVYVLTSGFSQIMQYFKDLNYENVLRKATKDCERYLKQFHNIELLPLKVIENTFALKSSEVHSFMNFLKSAKPDYVCLSSSGAKKTGQILGSFAESYLRQSDFLTFVIGPNTKLNGNLQSVLVPIEATTDTQPFVQNALNKEKLPFVHILKLFHKITLEDYFIFDKNDLSFYGERGLSKEDLTKIAEKVVVENFENLHKSTDITDVTCIVKSSDDSITETIFKEVQRQGSGLILLKTSTGPFLEAFIGSITKDIINGSPVPVAIYPYKYRMKN